MRIVGGSARGRTLRAVPGDSTRPTADRVRQSLFDLLGQRMDGLRVLDLYAGTGALALEALSRGALSATLIEKDPKAFAVLERNASELGFVQACSFVRDDVLHALPRLRGTQFDLVFSDPPYALQAGQPVLDALRSNDLLAPGARVILEGDKRSPVPAGLPLQAEKKYGDTRVWVFS